LSKRAKKWVQKTDPDLVDVAYRLSRDIQVELGRQAQLRHDDLISKIKRLIEDHVSNPVLKHSYISYAQKVASLREKYDKNLASRQVAGEIIKWETRGLNRDLMVSIAKALNTDPEPTLRTYGGVGGGVEVKARAAAKIVAASDAPSWIKDRADYVCDGFDDQVEINSALGEANVVILSPGTFRLSGEVPVPSNRVITGSGWATKLSFSGDRDISYNVFEADSVENIVIEDLWIYLDSTPDQAGDWRGVETIFCVNVTLRNLKVENFTFSAVHLVGPDSFVVERCWFLQDPSIAELRGEYASDISGAKFGKIINNVFGDKDALSLKKAIFMEGSMEVLLFGNIFWNTREETLRLYHGNKDITISNNFFRGGGGASDDTFPTIKLEALEDSPSYDYYISNNRFDSEELTNLPNYCISIENPYVNYTVIHGNNFRNGARTGEINNQGSYTMMRDNIALDGSWMTDI